jgi:hypothetical protein
MWSIDDADMLVLRLSRDRGVALLDDRVPDWRERIDARALNMMSPSLCVLGQLFGGYVRGLRMLDLLEDPHGHGFTIGWEDADVARAFRALTSLWREVLCPSP